MLSYRKGTLCFSSFLLFVSEESSLILSAARLVGLAATVSLRDCDELSSELQGVPARLNNAIAANSSCTASTHLISGLLYAVLAQYPRSPSGASSVSTKMDMRLYNPLGFIAARIISIICK